MEIIERELGNVKDLPTLPMVLRQVSALIETNETDMKKIADVIMTDTALTVRIIRLVNSAFYGLRNRVTSITQAVVIVGLRAVYNLMLGLTVIKLFKNGKSTHFDPNLLWRHSFGCGLLSQKVAHLVNYSFPDECFIGGLLHDMGRLVLDQFLHDKFTKACAYALAHDCSLLAGERTVIGFDHAEAGAWLAERLNIPDSFVATIRYHHAVAGMPQQSIQYADIVRIIATANRICTMEGVGNSGEIHYDDSERLLDLKQLGVDQKQVAAVVNAEVDSAIAKWNS
jgi:HD-like signal output (HDOD) protein